VREFAIDWQSFWERFRRIHMQDGNSGLNRRSKLDAWSATRRWTITGAGNLRRIVNTPGHAFVLVEKKDEVLALYRSVEDPNWITDAVKRTLAEAKAALLPCAVEAQVQWR